MKVVFLLQTDPVRPKPVLRALREAETLAREGWTVSFVSWIKEPRLLATPQSDPFPVRRIRQPVPPLGSSFLGRARAYMRTTKLLANAVVEERPDLLIAHDFEVLHAGTIAKRVMATPLIYDSHEDWPALIAENSRIESLLAGIQERRLCWRVDHVVTVSEPIADKFRARGRPTTVLYSARPSADVQITDRRASRLSFGYAADDFVVGFAGAFGRGRGLDVLLAAMARLPPSVKGLLVGGPQEEAEELRARASGLGLTDRVRIDAYRPFPELSPYYAAMDLGVILLEPWPNHLRAMPNKLFDYMAHGVAVIVPDYPAMGPIARDGPCGWTVKEVRWESVSALIQEARMSGEAAARGRNGREAYLRKYAWDNQETKFLQIAVSLVPSSNPKSQ